MMFNIDVSVYACVYFCECSNSDTEMFPRLLDLVGLGMLATDQKMTHQKIKKFQSACSRQD